MSQGLKNLIGQLSKKLSFSAKIPLASSTPQRKRLYKDVTDIGPTPGEVMEMPVITKDPESEFVVYNNLLKNIVITKCVYYEYMY